MSCGNHVEVYQRFSDLPLTDCGVCGGALRKVFHPAGILFKGSGFYATDSRANAGKEASGDGDKAEGTKAEKGSGKGDGAKKSEQGKASGASEGAKAESSSSSEGSTGSSGSTKEKSA